MILETASAPRRAAAPVTPSALRREVSRVPPAVWQGHRGGTPLRGEDDGRRRRSFEAVGCAKNMNASRTFWYKKFTRNRSHSKWWHKRSWCKKGSPCCEANRVC